MIDFTSGKNSCVFGKFEVATLQDLELHKYCHNLEQLKVATTKHIAQLRSAESGPVKSEIEGGGRNPRFWHIPRLVTATTDSVT
jgi:hypothetical protein